MTFIGKPLYPTTDHVDASAVFKYSRHNCVTTEGSCTCAEHNEERKRADRLEAENAALRSALETARMPHHRNDGDPWFTCPVAWREDHEGYYEGTCFQCDGKPCDHGCNCGADEQNAGIDRALATPSRRREGE